MLPTLTGCFLLLLLAIPAYCQSFNFSMREAITPSEAVMKQVRAYVELHDRIPMRPIGKQYPYIPVFNVLNRRERRFTDGVYYFKTGSHDSGRLFINRKWHITILRSGSAIEILTDFLNFLKHNQLSNRSQISYLAAVSAYLKFWNDDQQMLIDAGALIEAK